MQTTVSNCTMNGSAISKEHHKAIEAIAKAVAENSKVLALLAKSLELPEFKGTMIKIGE